MHRCSRHPPPTPFTVTVTVTATTTIIITITTTALASDHFEDPRGGLMDTARDLTRALDAALQALHNARAVAHPTALAVAARAVSRVADEAELAALETADRALRAPLLARVADARHVAADARIAARVAAREQLLAPHAPASDRPAGGPGAQKEKENEKENEASRMARHINDALRRTTAVVADEVSRSRVAGTVVADSSQRLRRTRDEHVSLRASLRAGGQVLRRVRASEMVANVVVLASFAFFFVVAALVASRRVRSSLVVGRIASLPFSLARGFARWLPTSTRAAPVLPTVSVAPGAVGRREEDVRGRKHQPPDSHPDSDSESESDALGGTEAHPSADSVPVDDVPADKVLVHNVGAVETAATVGNGAAVGKGGEGVHQSINHQRLVDEL